MNYRRTLVIAPMFYGSSLPESCNWFLESSQMHGIEILQLGLGESWPGYYKAKILHVWEATKDLQEYDYVVLIDANDSLFGNRSRVGDEPWCRLVVKTCFDGGGEPLEDGSLLEAAGFGDG